MTADRSAPAVDDADLVNGPEDVLGDWDEVEWRRVEQDVRRLRQRIFTASQAGDLKRVRNLQKRLLCWIRGHDQVIARPGRGGHMPPRSSMARATRASGERNPKAMRVRSRSFVFTLSTRAFDSPWLSAASMPARWSRMERASLTNAGSRQRQAHFSQASSSAIPSAPLS